MEKMKLTVGQCFSIYQTIEAIKKDNKCDFETIWQLSDAQLAVEKHAKRADEEQQKLVKKYGTEQDDQMFKIDPEKIPEFNAKINEVMNYDVEVEIKKLSYEKLLKSDLKFNGETDFITFKKIVEKPAD